MSKVKVFTATELRTGIRAEFERDITDEDVAAFAENSGDWNPLHVDAEYARDTRFRRPIVHGAFQVGLASALLGCHLPGCRVLLGSINAKFPQPLYYPVRVRVRGEVSAWNPEAVAGMLRVVVEDLNRNMPTAEIALGFTFHQAAKLEEAKPTTCSQDGRHVTRPVVLVTGAAGGIGSAITAELAKDYQVCGVTNQQPLPECVRARGHVREIRADLSTGDCIDRLNTALGSSALYGIVHAAWPGAPHGGLLAASDDVIERQLLFGTTHIVRLARLLTSRVGGQGGRMIVLGSIVGSQKPAIRLAAYSLAKGAAEQTVRLLAPELARKQITINTVSPSFVPAGINQASNDSQILRETALIPMGRLCQTEDIVSTIRFLLSPQAAFLSGQTIGLTGAQL